jgi:hypothetical protein
MKKLLLGLGTLSLAILPVAAMVSCSATTPTVETEAKKLTVEVAVKDAELAKVLTSAVVTEITDAKEAAAKLVVVEKYTTIPTIAEGFTFEIKSAAVKVVAEAQVVDVTITVTETATPANTATATLSITGLTVDSSIVTPTLDTEAAKFETAETLKPAIETTVAAAAITGATDAVAKKIALEVYINLPTLADGFTFEVKTATVDVKVNTTLNVTITITDATAVTKDVTLVITGFTATA